MPSTIKSNRIFYAVHSVGLAPFNVLAQDFDDHDNGATPFRTVSGVQSLGINTNFNTEQIFQLGQLELYQNVEDLPDVEITVEKVLDGTALIQHLATPKATAPTLLGRFSNERCTLNVNYYTDLHENASGTPYSRMASVGMYVNSVTLTLPVDGNFTESVTLVSNDKRWASGAANDQVSGVNILGWGHLPSYDADQTTPAHASGVLRRQHLLMSGCMWPTEIPGMGMHDTAAGLYTRANTGATPAGKNETIGLTATSTTPIGDKFNVHIQNVTVSTDLGRTNLLELGRRGPYHRYVDFPVEVTCSIDVIENEFGDLVQALEDPAGGTNLQNQNIFLVLVEDSGGTNDMRIDLGRKNTLTSVSSTGGDTGGGNRTTTYSYRNFNNYTVTFPDKDPAAQAHPVA